jgi:hypothetical protein
MAVVTRTSRTLRVYQTHLTDEQYELYKNNDGDGEFWDLYWDELIKDEEFIGEDVLEEWLDVEEQ